MLRMKITHLTCSFYFDVIAPPSYGHPESIHERIRKERKKRNTRTESSPDSRLTTVPDYSRKENKKKNLCCHAIS